MGLLTITGYLTPHLWQLDVINNHPSHRDHLMYLLFLSKARPVPRKIRPFLPITGGDAKTCRMCISLR